MNAYLITWNPARSPWNEIEDESSRVQSGKRVRFQWSTGNTKSIVRGDRLFILKQGDGQNGIFGVGTATSNVYEDGHWDAQRAARGDTANYIKGVWENLLNPRKDDVLSAELLSDRLSNTYWAPPASGFPIRDNNIDELEHLWRNHLQKAGGSWFPNEAETAHVHLEGAVQRVLVNRYERDPDARAECLNHFGLRCQVCDCDFEELYGELGEGFIHVHHIKVLSKLGNGYVIKPTKHLVPVCPNCHAMLHRENPPLSMRKLKSIIKQQKETGKNNSRVIHSHALRPR